MVTRTRKKTPRKAAAPPIAPRQASVHPALGRPLFVEDIAAMYRGRVSLYWVRHKFAPELKRRAGKFIFWYEQDALEWMAAQRVA